MPDQAVVIVHGMGQQRPMDFLRSFAKAALAADATVFSQPDPLSDSYELRRLRVKRSGPGEPVTFLYEYYWAHQMVGSSLRHLWPLAKRAFLRLPWKVSGSLRFLYVATWLLLIYLAIQFVSFLGSRTMAEGGVVSDFLASLGLSAVGTVVAAVLLVVVQGFAVSYFGDVARYVDPAPDNIAIRQKIRADAVTLLDKLSERHDRVVVVAHSLGSFIALDALGFLWAENYFFKVKDGAAPQPALDAVEGLGEDPDGVDAFQSAQRALLKEQKASGSPWRITDLVTFGSPLAHAEMLLGSRRLSVADRQELREFPRCPPTPDDTTGLYSYQPDPPKPHRRLHYAAHFAQTRWTNVWFPSRWGVFGDWFSGPLAPVFGTGIADHPAVSGPSRHVPVLAHTKYFSLGAAGPEPGSSVAFLRAVLAAR